MGDNEFTFLLMDLILLVVILGLTLLVFNVHGIYLIAGAILLLFLIFFSFVSMIGVYKGSNWGWTFLSFLFALILVDMAYMYIKGVPIGRLFLIVLVFSSFGFLISVMKIRRTGKAGIRKQAAERYVASKTGKRYHKESCDWAQKIKPEKKIHLTEAEAKDKGLKACDCVK